MTGTKAASSSPIKNLLSKRELGLSIAYHGKLEEFHQKRGNYFMYDYHKNQRLLMEKQYRAFQVHQEG